MFRPQTQVVDLTLEDTVMIGAIQKGLNFSRYSFQMDDAGNHIRSIRFSWRKLLAYPHWRKWLLKTKDGQKHGVVKFTVECFTDPIDERRLKKRSRRQKLSLIHI